MKTSEAKIGRIFVIRLEDNDKLPDAIETFAKQNNILRGMCILIGGIQSGSKIVVGPNSGKAIPPIPMCLNLEGVHEVSGVGTIFPDESGNSVLHLHAAFGREKNTLTGCIRPGVEIWKLGEVILWELIDNSGYRKKNDQTGFLLLEPNIT